MTNHPFPSKVSVFLDALDAAATRHRHDDPPRAGAPHATLGAWRWSAIAMIPAALIAVSWML